MQRFVSNCLPPKMRALRLTQRVARLLLHMVGFAAPLAYRILDQTIALRVGGHYVPSPT